MNAEKSGARYDNEPKSFFAKASEFDKPPLFDDSRSD